MAMDFFIIQFQGDVAFTKQYNNCYLLCLVHAGQLTVHINKDLQILKRGQCLLVETPDFLTLNIHGHVQLAYVAVSSLDYLKRFLISFPLLFLYSTKKRLVVISLDKQQEHLMVGLLGYLWYRRQRIPSILEMEEELFSMAWQLLFFALYENLTSKPYANASRQTQLFLAFLMEVKESKGKAHRIRYYAAKLCISTNYLSKVVKQISGQPPRYFIVHTILLESKKLFYTHKSLKEITAIMGFSSVHHFSAFFAKYTGMSPSAFMKRM